MIALVGFLAASTMCIVYVCEGFDSGNSDQYFNAAFQVGLFL